jgi:hypothetical protein
MQIKLEIEHDKLKYGFVNIMKAQQIATAKTLNTIAFLSRKNAIKNVKDDFILRNTFTVRNIRVDKANETYSPENQESRIYATDKADYMRLQEEGGIKKPKRGKSLGIGQIAARGGRKKSLIQKKLYLSKIQKQIVPKIRNKGGRKSSLAQMAEQAFNEKKFLMYKKNIYKITSFSRANGKVQFRKQHIYNISQKNARIKANPWMKPAIYQPARDSQNIYNSNIKKMLREKEII